VADEYRRRIGQANGEAGPLEQVARLDRQIATVQRGIDRLIDCYAGGFIEKAEFEPRIAGLKLRRSQLQEQQRAAVKTANSERELSLVISRLEDFSAKVTHGLDQLDWLGMREIIHTVVRRIEIDRDSIEVVFRVPPTGGPSRGGLEPPRRGIWQDCTNVQARNRGRYAFACLSVSKSRSARDRGMTELSTVPHRRRIPAKSSLVAGTGRIRVLGLLLETPTSGFDPDSDMSGPLLL
jgi:site-specific DNA recombinase